MRSDKEMFDLILGVAQNDERIRAVYMNGSRTNPNAPKDIFRDYDIVYVVTETASFINDEKWISIFGELLMIQEPDKNDKLVGMAVDFERSYGYLMLFKDGNRIDLRIQTKEAMIECYEKDKLTIPLLDKDKILPLIPDPTDIDYHVKKPTKAMFISCYNDFWWCLQNVAKGIWRGELPYAKQMFEYVIRVRLDEMVSWWIGTKHDFQVSTGKMGKYFKKYLPEPYWEMYKETYSDSDYDNLWNSIFVTCELFRALSQDVAGYFSFIYPVEDDINMTEYLKQVRNLPVDARGIIN
ncbi:aminoglycoside 6-adenylyltransferase [Metabacillus rhizolycopersici]|uniref:Aminoglycoside 6-adenylyltransferase n=1 Tax=Metabacillus rhizolycopersici TaxID=2875709 RepID=A0ABS7V057_9BACI|nr:aminoglycoside 6-adenylyltransferase [Metabacillus rhizolycopersici]MBZ5753572.1 aminoglycoside 6-adenylyltransferase [Metabacillus rhizolycopersici]